MRGIGPFQAGAVHFQLNDRGSVVATAQVSNEGTKPGRAKCQFTARDAAGGALGEVSTTTVQIAAGATSVVSTQIPGVGNQAASVTATCQ